MSGTLWNPDARRRLTEREGMAQVRAQERRDFAAAHAEGLHDDLPREFCPECKRQGRRR